MENEVCLQKDCFGGTPSQQRVIRRLEREGLLIPDPEQPWLDLDFHEPMDSVSATSADTSDRRIAIPTV